MTHITQADRDAAERFNAELRANLTGTQLYNLAGVLASRRAASIAPLVEARPDVLEAMARAHCDFFGGEGWWDTGLIADTRPKALEAMKLALAAALQSLGEQGK